MNNCFSRFGHCVKGARTQAICFVSWYHEVFALVIPLSSFPPPQPQHACSPSIILRSRGMRSCSPAVTIISSPMKWCLWMRGENCKGGNRTQASFPPRHCYRVSSTHLRMARTTSVALMSRHIRYLGSDALVLGYSVCGWVVSVSIMRELVRKAESWDPPQMYWTGIFLLTNSSGSERCLSGGYI